MCAHEERLPMGKPFCSTAEALPNKRPKRTLDGARLREELSHITTPATDSSKPTRASPERPANDSHTQPDRMGCEWSLRRTQGGRRRPRPPQRPTAPPLSPC